MGITLDTYRSVYPSATEADLKSLTKQDAVEFYRTHFFYKYRISEFPAEIQDLFFDMTVNHGYGNASEMLQRVIGVEVDGVAGSGTIAAAKQYDGDLRKSLLEERSRFYKSIIKNDPSQKKVDGLM